MEQQSDRTKSERLNTQDYLCYFGHNVSLVCDRELDCEISPEDAYERIKSLWLELRNLQPEIINHLTEIELEEIESV